MSTILEFTKMQGAGNDFIMIDNRDYQFSDLQKSGLAEKLCPRALAVGADGIIFLENDNEYDAKWDFYNSDGSSAEMCGNGARCFAVFARDLGIFETKFVFRTTAGVILAEIISPSKAKVQLTDTPSLKKIKNFGYLNVCSDIYFINTGVPHAVVPVNNVEDVDILATGPAIRYHQEFSPAGTNVNFISKINDKILIRTYERGVEAETLACGTGAVAGAIAASAVYGLSSPVKVVTRSGECLQISYNATDTGNTDVYLEGSAKVVYKGTTEI